MTRVSPLVFRDFAASAVTPQSDRQVSPLVLSDRLLTLAQDAERAGFPLSAGHLVSLAHAVFDEIPNRR